jgi:ribonucleotide reductase beta subunit family protein with ferritin-like domain
MQKKNLKCVSFRLNLDDPAQLKVYKVLKGLNPKYYKSYNKFVLEAVQFYIEYYGNENMLGSEGDEKTAYLKKDDLENIKQELIQAAVAEARLETIRALGSFASGMGVLRSTQDMRNGGNADIDNEIPEDDEVIAGLALNWMMGSGGDNE